MQNDLHHGFFVLYLRYFRNCMIRSIKGLLAARWGLETSPRKHGVANKPFFVPAWNAAKEIL